MSELRRLLDGEGTEAERVLLDAAKHDEAPAAARQRLLCALGVEGPLSAPVGREATDSLGSDGAGAALRSGSSWSASSLAPLAKWFSLGAVGGLLALGSARTVEEVVAPPPVEGEPRSAPGGASGIRSEPSGAEGSGVRSSEAEPSADLHAEREDRASGASQDPSFAVREKTLAVSGGELGKRAARDSRPSTDHGSGGIGEEVLVLDRARVALARGEVAAALAVLQEHRQRFPSGALAPEASVLRIRALLEGQRREEALRLAQRFLEQHPRSPLAARVRALTEDAADAASHP